MAAFDSASLTEGERTFLRALSELGVEYLLVGMSAALLQGARGATEDIDLWFQNLDDPRIGEAARRSGGFWVTRAQPPLLGGMGERFDVVVSMLVAREGLKQRVLPSKTPGSERIREAGAITPEYVVAP